MTNPEKLLIDKSKPGRVGYTLPELQIQVKSPSELIPDKFLRKSDFKFPEISENEVARHFVRLSHLNYNIDNGLYPLGSCTMKYNPKINEKIAGIPGFNEIHPKTEPQYVQGALQLMYELGEALKEITGLQGVSLQPSAGSQGELAGILMFRAYHMDRNDSKRKKILIPSAAHGTNPASAAIAGFEIVELKSNDKGRVDLDDLASKCNDEVAGFMLTNPNTLGIFETSIERIEELVHGCGGLMYMDGANLNALLGIARPGDMKFDCVHINLHKTFSTPHGGGGPGAGPVCVSDKLVPFLPQPQIMKDADSYYLNRDLPKSIGKLHTFFGNFGVLVRAYTYIRMHGAIGLRKVSENAIINANYLKSLVKDEFEFPYDERPMHEFVMSGDRQKAKGVSTKDIAKRLLDYGFHAPTVYFPLVVHEALLIEPTETEAKENIEDFANALLQINKEIDENPELVLSSPHDTPVRRLDEAKAARQLNIRW